ncbi:hypothetical protein D3C73_1116360 [compost metagenome]
MRQADIRQQIAGFIAGLKTFDRRRQRLQIFGIGGVHAGAVQAVGFFQRCQQDFAELGRVCVWGFDIQIEVNLGEGIEDLIQTWNANAFTPERMGFTFGK